VWLVLISTDGRGIHIVQIKRLKLAVLLGAVSKERAGIVDIIEM